MYTDNTKRRSLINRLLPSIVVSLICLFIASPFVFNEIKGGDGQAFLWQPQEVKAYNFSADLDKAAGKAKFDKPVSVPYLIGLTIKSFIALIGLVFLILVIIAGLRWMWSGGDEETIKAARQTIKNSILGAIIAWGAYVITYYVIDALF